MFINKLNQLYKPERILYFLPADDGDISDFYKGIVKPEIERYNGAFGTYDYPGLFCMDGNGGNVIGIEFRPDDDRIDYPTDLKSVMLPEMFFYSIEIDDDETAEREKMCRVFDEIAKDDDAHRLYTDLSLTKKDPFICMFSGDGKIRIMHECRIDSDKAATIINDDASRLEFPEDFDIT